MRLRSRTDFSVALIREVASCRLVLFERRAGGFDELAVLESNGTTHAEWSGRTPARSVTTEHVEVG